MLCSTITIVQKARIRKRDRVLVLNLDFNFLTSGIKIDPVFSNWVSYIK